MAIITTDLGKVSITPKGVYNTSTTYTVLDLVTNVSGSSYLSLTDNNINHPLSDTEWWQVVANVDNAVQNANDAAILANEKAGLANNAATNADNARLAIQGDLALKEATANKQNSLTPDGTGTKFPTVDAVNAGLAGAGGNNLIASYTLTSNKEIVIDSIDVATNTFTRTNHTLQNEDIIYPTLNWDAEDSFPLAVFPGGVNFGAYYVINKTDNTFQLSLTSGGSSITLNVNETMDLTKWHFENGNVSTLDITGLDLTKCIFIYKGKMLKIGSFYSGAIETLKSYTTSTGYNRPYYSGGGGNIFGYMEVRLETKPYLLKSIKGSFINGNTSSANSTTNISEIKARMNTIDKITSVGIQVVGIIANGTTIEIYKI